MMAAEVLDWERGRLTRLVDGAPFQVGDSVEVVTYLDPTAGDVPLGSWGRVVHQDYSCGCGQSYPRDPMVGVDFGEFGVHEFWSDELRLRASELGETRE